MLAYFWFYTFTMIYIYKYVYIYIYTQYYTFPGDIYDIIPIQMRCRCHPIPISSPAQVGEFIRRLGCHF